MIFVFDDETINGKVKGSATKTSVLEIEGMQMLTREQSKNKSSVCVCVTETPVGVGRLQY